MSTATKALTPITEAQRMLAEADTLPKLKDLRDYATGAQAWAKARDLGIEAENQAAEVVIRAERKIGRILIDMAERGERASFESPRAEDMMSAVTFFDMGIVGDAAVKQAWRWQQLAKLDDDTFERLLEATKVEGARLAKFNFYNALKRGDQQKEAARTESPTPEDTGFMQFRAGAHALLGWQVDNDGVGRPNENGLLTLPDDELVQMARLIRLLANAYNEAKAARG